MILKKDKLSSKYSTQMLDSKHPVKETYRFNIFYWFKMPFSYTSNAILCEISFRRVSKQGRIKSRKIWVIRKKLSKDYDSLTAKPRLKQNLKLKQLYIILFLTYITFYTIFLLNKLSTKTLLIKRNTLKILVQNNKWYNMFQSVCK